MLGRWEVFERPVLEGIPYPIGWHSVAGPHLTARELGKCSVVMCPAGRGLEGNGFSEHLTTKHH